MNKDRFILLHDLMNYWITLGLQGGFKKKKLVFINALLSINTREFTRFLRI
jgi:hypothetical protein